MLRILILILILCASLIACPCTTFFINHQGKLLFGRNYDWVSGTGLLLTNQKGLMKTSMKVSDGQTISWFARYGSITFNQYGREFPTGGMNEAGLVVELMWLDETEYPDEDERAAIGVLQWIQYQLDNHATVEEVISSDKKLRISKTDPPLHYLIADARGNAATIEWLNGNLVVHQGKDLPFPVLANSTYAISVSSYSGGSKQSYDNSIQRFSGACDLLKKLHETTRSVDLVDYSYHILSNVSQGNFTKWSIVYDISEKTIHFRTLENNNSRSIRFSDINFSCEQRSLAIDLNGPENGDLKKSMRIPDENLARKSLEKSVFESRQRVTIPPAVVDKILAYPVTTKCN